jgi:hypothetical protein
MYRLYGRTVTREFDVSHPSRTCPVRGEFERFVNTVVIERFDALAADPPAHLHWDQLDRTRTFLIGERVSRTDHSIEDFKTMGPGDDGEGRRRQHRRRSLITSHDSDREPT